eukprot:scaffold232302_cov32-Tisochrysis_lutea.AAC.4
MVRWSEASLNSTCAACRVKLGESAFALREWQHAGRTESTFRRVHFHSAVECAHALQRARRRQ